MDVGLAAPADLPHLARLVWLHAAPHEQAREPVESFAASLQAWWSDHAASHLPFLARLDEGAVVGMAWLALLPRVPRPGLTTRWSADVQSVFVLPEQRGRRVGTALVRAAAEHATALGAGRVTVHSSHLAVPVYERLGFSSSPELLQRVVD